MQLRATDTEGSIWFACNSVTSVARAVGRLSTTEGKELELTATNTNAPVCESKEPNLFQSKSKEFNRSSGSYVFTIGRGQSSKAYFKIIWSSRKKRTTPLQKFSTNVPEESALIKHSFGTNTQVKFTFSIPVSLGFPLSVAANEQKGFAFRVSPAGGYNFTPYVIEEHGQEQSCQGLTKSISTAIVKNCDDDNNEAFSEDSADFIDESLIKIFPECYQNATGRLILSAKRHRKGTGNRDRKASIKLYKEDIEVMFSHRAKLYRFSPGEKKCKERGVGSISLLRMRQSGKVRLFMRQDQESKICANLQITTDMKLQPNAGSNSSWAWIIPADLPEQRCKAEEIAVRFRSKEIAKDFKQTFETCQDILKNQTPVKKLQEDQGNEEFRGNSLAKPKTLQGPWRCDVCLLRDDFDKVKCVACGSPKLRVEPKLPFGSTSQSARSGSHSDWPYLLVMCFHTISLHILV